MSRLSDFFSNKPYLMLPDKTTAASKDISGAALKPVFEACFKVKVTWRNPIAIDIAFKLYPATEMDRLYPSMFPVWDKLLNPSYAGDCDNKQTVMDAIWHYCFPGIPILHCIGVAETNHAFIGIPDMGLGIHWYNVVDTIKYTKIIDAQIR